MKLALVLLAQGKRTHLSTRLMRGDLLLDVFWWLLDSEDVRHPINNMPIAHVIPMRQLSLAFDWQHSHFVTFPSLQQGRRRKPPLTAKVLNYPAAPHEPRKNAVYALC